MDTSKITLKIMKIIGNAMEVNNISYGQLAKETGIPKSTLQRYVTGSTTKISIDALSRIGSVLDISMDIAKAMSLDTTLHQKETFSESEKDLIHKYRCLPPAGKATVDAVLNVQYDIVKPKVIDKKII